MTMGSGRQKVRNSYGQRPLAVQPCRAARSGEAVALTLTVGIEMAATAAFQWLKTILRAFNREKVALQSFQRVSCRLSPSPHCSWTGFQLRYELIGRGPASARRSTDL
jgi:hypothetical protein